MELNVFMLAGGVVPAPMASALGWPTWRLPLAEDCSVVEAWLFALKQPQLQELLVGDIEMTVLISSHSAGRETKVPERVRVVEEKCPHRGTAGVVADELRRRVVGPKSRVMLIEGSSLPILSLEKLVRQAACGEDELVVFLAESALARYCGVSIFDVEVLNLVPEVGFFDFKEQLLPAVRSAGGLIEAVRVADRARRIRTRAEWLDAVRAWRDFRARPEVVIDCGPNLAEGEGDRSVISRTAFTAGARVVSSIVMDEAVVEPGALVARSVIGPGMRVPAGTRVIDAILADPAAGDAAIRRSGASSTVSVASE